MKYEIVQVLYESDDYFKATQEMINLSLKGLKVKVQENKALNP
jgi:hypothetical protein